VQAGSLLLNQLGAIDCVALAFDAGTAFSVKSQTMLRIEDVSGNPASSAQRATCNGFRVHSVDALGNSQIVSQNTTVLVTAFDAGLYGLSDCSDASHDGGLSLTIIANLSSAAAGFRAFAPVTTQVITAVSTDNASVGSGTGQFSITCIASGQPCGPNGGSCCNGCNVLASNTCY
jgi:hypothetical protein